MTKESLSNKIEEWINPWSDKESAIATRNVREKIQNALRRLKEDIGANPIEKEIIDGIFKEEFGDKLI